MELSQRARVRAGDHDEFGVLFTEHARAVYNHAFRLTGNWSAAEEVVSLTFLEAWRLRGTVRPEGGDGQETSSMEPLHERQIWLPAANVCATGLLIEQGERTLISPFPVVNGKVDRHPPKGTPMPNFTCPVRATSATPHIGCCSPSPPSRTRCSPTSRPARSGLTTIRPPRSAT